MSKRLYQFSAEDQLRLKINRYNKQSEARAGSSKEYSAINHHPQSNNIDYNDDDFDNNVDYCAPCDIIPTNQSSTNEEQHVHGEQCSHNVGKRKLAAPRKTSSKKKTSTTAEAGFNAMMNSFADDEQAGRFTTNHDEMHISNYDGEEEDNY